MYLYIYIYKCIYIYICHNVPICTSLFLLQPQVFCKCKLSAVASVFNILGATCQNMHSLSLCLYIYIHMHIICTYAKLIKLIQCIISLVYLQHFWWPHIWWLYCIGIDTLYVHYFLDHGVILDQVITSYHPLLHNHVVHRWYYTQISYEYHSKSSVSASVNSLLETRC